MTEKFYKVNDYDWVLPGESQKGHNHLRELINSFFKEGELLFCLLERVTITNKTGIGNIYIFSHLPKNEEEKIYHKYKQIVKEVQTSKKVNPSEYVEWYKSQKSYFLIDANEGADISIFEDEAFDWGDNWKPKNAGDNSFTVDLKSNLHSEKILDYLNYYSEKLRKELDFSKYPHFAILIKPVCVINDETGVVYPLGNLFLHFGTKTKKEELFYVELINKFLLVWFRVQGNKLVEEIQAETLQKIEQGKIDESHLPQLSSKAKKRLTEKLNGSKYSLTDYFNKHKNSTNHREGFGKAIKKLKEVIIPYLLHHTQVDKKNSAPTITDIEDLQRDAITGLKDLDNNFDLFIQILLRRKLFCICYFLFNYDIRNIHSFLTGTNLTSQTSSDIGSVYNYFLINLAISIGKEKNWEGYKKEGRKQKIFKQLTKEENNFLNECLEYIRSMIDNLKINSFNNLSHLKLTST